MITDPEGRVLVQERLSKPSNAWSGLTFPGGHVEPGETVVVSVIREVREDQQSFEQYFCNRSRLCDPRGARGNRPYDHRCCPCRIYLQPAISKGISLRTLLRYIEPVYTAPSFFLCKGCDTPETVRFPKSCAAALS